MKGSDFLADLSFRRSDWLESDFFPTSERMLFRQREAKYLRKCWRLRFLGNIALSVLGLLLFLVFAPVLQGIGGSIFVSALAACVFLLAGIEWKGRSGRLARRALASASLCAAIGASAYVFNAFTSFKEDLHCDSFLAFVEFYPYSREGSWIPSIYAGLADDQAMPMALFFAGILLVRNGWLLRYVLGHLRSVGSHSVNRFGLYLRPFLEDDKTIRKEDSERAKQSIIRYIPVLGWIMPPMTNFDSFFARAFRGTGIQALAIGNPHKKVANHGTLKIFPRDGAWKHFAKRLILRSDFVVIRCHETENFGWELHQIADLGCVGKVYLYIGDSLQEKSRWQQVISMLAGAGIDVPEAFPGAGTLLGFSASGALRSMHASVRHPHDLSQAIIGDLRRNGI
jgi:hypothetical protein